MISAEQASLAMIHRRLPIRKIAKTLGRKSSKSKFFLALQRGDPMKSDFFSQNVWGAWGVGEARSRVCIPASFSYSFLISKLQIKLPENNV